MKPLGDRKEDQFSMQVEGFTFGEEKPTASGPASKRLLRRKRRRRDYLAGRRATAAILYVEGGLSMREVALELGVSKQRVWHYLADLDVPRRPRGRPRRERCRVCGR